MMIQTLFLVSTSLGTHYDIVELENTLIASCGVIQSRRASSRYMDVRGERELDVTIKPVVWSLLVQCCWDENLSMLDSSSSEFYTPLYDVLDFETNDRFSNFQLFRNGDLSQACTMREQILGIFQISRLSDFIAGSSSSGSSIVSSKDRILASPNSQLSPLKFVHLETASTSLVDSHSKSYLQQLKSLIEPQLVQLVSDPARQNNDFKWPKNFSTLPSFLHLADSAVIVVSFVQGVSLEVELKMRKAMAERLQVCSFRFISSSSSV
jgi:hypothetical protein